MNAPVQQQHLRFIDLACGPDGGTVAAEEHVVVVVAAADAQPRALQRPQPRADEMGGAEVEGRPRRRPDLARRDELVVRDGVGVTVEGRVMEVEAE